MKFFIMSGPVCIVNVQTTRNARLIQLQSNLDISNTDVSKYFLLYFLMNYRDFSGKSKLIIPLCQTVKLSLSISLFQKIGFS